MEWTEVTITVPTRYTDAAADNAQMTVPYGLYLEDYSDLEEGAREIAHIDLVDEELLARDRGLLLAEVSITLNNMHVPLHALQARELKDGMTSVTLTLGTVNVEQLTNIMSNLRKIDGVVEVKRANQ